MSSRLISSALATIALMLSVVGHVQAQAFPSKSVRIVTYFSAGSGPDVVIRVVADQLSKVWSQAVVVENKPGANGIIAIDALAQAAPDGYTLGVTDSAVLTVNPHMYASMKVSPERDITPLSMWFNVPFYLIVPASGSIKTVPQLIEYAKANPGKLSYGSPTGVGNPGHLGMELFKAETGTDIVHVPYKTSQPMMTDLATGRLPVAWASMGSARAMLQSGDVIPIAVGSKTRQPARPEVPTLREAGGPPNLEVNAWIGLFGPKGIPADVVAKITADVDKVVKSPEVAKRIVDLGNETVTGTPETMAELIRNDSARYGKLIKDLGIKGE
jgi:tripartite-type tricarboxylate transporter receptor subunit TctC